MYNIIRYIRQNRLKIIGIIIFILFIYSMIITANEAYKNEEKQKIQNVNEEKIETDGTVNLSEKNCKKIIEEFLKNCTNGDYEKAYSYLSKYSINSKYSTLEEFEKEYCLANSLKGKGYKIEKEKGKQYTYKIDFNEMLATGKNNSKKITHYYSITVENEHDIKINIE